MRYLVVSIRDLKTGFLQPTVDLNEASAVRNFEHAVLRNDDNLFFSHPEDYALYDLGLFDTDTGEFIFDGLPRQIITADQVIQAALTKRGDRDGSK